MVCEHLAELEQRLLNAGAKETYRGTPWGKNCREWVYYDVILDVDALRTNLRLPDFVEVHENTDERSGLEKGFYCSLCHDAVMGRVKGANIVT